MRARCAPVGRALAQLPEAWGVGCCRSVAGATGNTAGPCFTASAAAAAAAPTAVTAAPPSAGATTPLLKEVLVYRWSPEKSEKPKYDSFKVDLSK